MLLAAFVELAWSCSTRGFVRVKLRGRGRNFPSPKRLGVVGEGFFPVFLKIKD